MNEDHPEQSRTYRHFRTSLDIGMGFFYIIIGALIMYVKYFGTMELPDGYAYILGGLMVLYGGFRIYRGMVALKQQRRS